MRRRRGREKNKREEKARGEEGREEKRACGIGNTSEMFRIRN